MCLSIAGPILLSIAAGFGAILRSVGLVGIGSAVFHPEASRIARMASGGRHGFAQALFAPGSSGGPWRGPLLAVLIVRPQDRRSIAWFSVGALIAMLLRNRSAFSFTCRSLPGPARIEQEVRWPKGGLIADWSFISNPAVSLISQTRQKPEGQNHRSDKQQ